MSYPDQPEPAGALSTITDERVETSTGDGDHDRFAHYVVRNKLTEAMVEGTPLQALCGKVWVPSRDPKKYPVCPECKEIYDGIPPGEGDDSDA
ncbi:hypothetical protein GCM10009547_04470 [Sporichthya brevicatena]|jgi:hypothetical protein|uniref:DUF3039 domain-containing protein n=1 Tax=Sporichthya brevicatena TaxID=171442 RepID=A0ABP3RA95_9ACTN